MQVDGQEKEAVGLPLNSQQRKENLDTISEAFLKIEMPFEELFYSSLDLFIHTVLGGQAAAVHHQQRRGAGAEHPYTVQNETAAGASSVPTESITLTRWPVPTSSASSRRASTTSRSNPRWRKRRGSPAGSPIACC